MNNRQQFIKVLRRKLADGNKQLIHIAAEALEDGWSIGYCEYTEHPELYRLAKPYACPYCGKLHSLKECQGQGVEEYRADPAAWKVKYL